MTTDRSAATLTIDQIAEAAGVGRSAVSNWRARHKDFPIPDSRGRFSLPEIEQWLIDHDRIDGPIKRTVSLWSLVDQLRSAGLVTIDILELVTAGLVYLEAAERFADAHPDPAADWTRVRDNRDDHLVDTLLSTAAMLELDDPALEGLLTVGLQRARGFPPALVRDLLDALEHATTPTTARFEVFEDVVQHFESLDRFHGEYATPDDLVELAVRLGGGDARVICDPALGQGGLLLSAAVHPGRSRPAAEIHGFELSRDVARRARARFYLYGVNADIRCTDALRTPFDELPDADLVLLDPPMGQRDWGDSELYLDPKWTFGAPPRNDATFAWLQLALAALNRGGRAVVFSAPGPLTRHAERGLRAALLDAAAIEAVIQLPARVRPETNIQLNILILRAPDGRRRDDVLFVDASTLGSAGRSLHRFDESDLDRVTTAVRSFRIGEVLDDEIAWTADRSTIASHDHVLDVSRYRPLPDLDVDALNERYDAVHRSLPELIAAAQRHGKRVAAAAPLAAVDSTNNQGSVAPAREHLSSLAHIVRGVRTPPSENSADPIVFGGREVAEGSNAPLRHTDLNDSRRRPVTVTTDDLVISLVGTSIRSAIVTDRHNGAVLGMECVVIRPVTNDVDRSWLQTWLQSSDFLEQAGAVATMTAGAKRLAVRDLSELTVPIPGLDVQRSNRDRLDDVDRAVDAANQLRTALEELRRLEVDIVFATMPPTRRRSERTDR